MSMKQPSRGGKLASAALLGFSLTGLLKARPARAYGYALGYLLLTSTTVGIGASIAGGVYLTVRSSRDRDRAETETTTRQLVDAALIGNRGELALQLDLLTDSPTAFAQLGTELSRGNGPAVDAMVHATGLPAARLASAWSIAGSKVGPVSDRDGATRQIVAFVDEIAPELTVSNEVLAAFGWQLVREQTSPEFPAKSQAHAAIATWLGVPEQAVTQATSAALADLGVSPADARAAIYANPDRFADVFSASIEAAQGEAVRARAASLARAADPGLSGTPNAG